ncbi:MAG: LysR family transcriptional regulator [Beduini sp.]
MNLKHYLIFREVAKTENFTRAAENLFLTQSAVSHAMKELESKVNTPLFERMHKSVKLTKSGELLLKEVLPLLEEMERLEARLGELKEAAPLSISSCITFAQIWLPRYIEQFQSMHHTKVQVEINSAASALKALLEGRADVAFIEGALPSQSFLMTPILNYDIGAYVSPNTAIHSKLSLKALLEHRLLLRERGSAVRETFESAVTLAGYQLFAQWVSVDSQTLIEAAKMGLGIAILPKVLVQQELKQNTLIELVITDLNLSNPITMVMNKNKKMTPMLEAFCANIPHDILL